MKDKIIEILDLWSMGISETREAVADEILKMAEFEALCNADIYEAHMNEHFEQTLFEQDFVEFTAEYYFDGTRWHVEGQEPMTTNELYEYWKNLKK